MKASWVNPGRRQLLSGAGVGAALALAWRQLSPQAAAAATLTAATAATLTAQAAPAAVASGTVYVTPQGNDSNDGMSWATAKLTVSGALAALPTGGIIFLSAGTFTETGLAIPSGGNLSIRGAGAGVTVLQAKSGDLWTLPASSDFVSFEDLTMTSPSGAGHLFNAAAASVSFWSWRRCQLIQANDAKCIWYTDGGTFINCTVSECNERHTLTATVPSWFLVGSGTISGNTWEKTRHTYTGNYAIWIQTTGPTAYNYGNAFRDITWEVCDGGFIKLLGQYGGSLENLVSYDGHTLARDGYAFASAGTLPCWGLQGAGLIRLNPQVLGSGIVDINCSGLARGVISGCNGTINLAGMDVLAENLLYDATPPTAILNNTDTTELSAAKGSLVRSPVKSVTASYQATVSDSIIVASAAKGGLTVTLPPVAGLAGKQYTVKKADSSRSAVKVAAYGTQRIDGAPSASLNSAYASLTVVCDGSAWQVI
jgi:hypothetical protein